MKKLLYLMPILCAVIVFVLMNFLGFGPNQKSEAADEENIHLAGIVDEYLTLTITSGSTADFGHITPLTPSYAPSGGTVASVLTNAANGYEIGVYDGSDTDSAMVHTDTTTYLPDNPNTISAPAVWGTTEGVGITLYSGTAKDTDTWGTGSSYNDALNKYCGIPQTSTPYYTVTGFHDSADASYWSFGVNVPNDQKTGTYAGDVTFSATETL